MTRRRWLVLAMALGAGLVVSPATAQGIRARGYVDRVDLATGAVRLRTYNGHRVVYLMSDAPILWNQREVDLADVPRFAYVEVEGHLGLGRRLMAERMTVLQGLETMPRAALLPGMLTVGQVVGVDINYGALYLRTRSGVRLVRVGTAPIVLRGRRITLADIALGDTVAVQFAAPHPSLWPVVDLVTVYPDQSPEEVQRNYRPVPLPR